MQASRVLSRCRGAGALRPMQKAAWEASHQITLARRSFLALPLPGQEHTSVSYEKNKSLTAAPRFLRKEVQRRCFASRKQGKHKDRKGYDAEPNKNESFQKKFVDPATRGELQKGHSSGIPKLAARKPKANLKEDSSSAKRSHRGRLPDENATEPGADESTLNPSHAEALASLSPDDLTDEEIDELRKEMEEKGMGTGINRDEIINFAHELAKDMKEDRPTEGGLGPPKGSGTPKRKSMIEEADASNFFAEELWDEKKYWWREEDYDHDLFLDDDFDYKDYVDKDGDFVFDYDEETKQDPFVQPILEGKSFDFTFEEALQSYKEEATPEELEEIKDLDMNQLLKDMEAEVGSVEPINESGWTEDDFKYVLDGVDEPTDEEFMASLPGASVEAKGKASKPRLASSTEDFGGFKATHDELLSLDTFQQKKDVDPEDWFFEKSHDVLDIAARPTEDFPDEVPENPLKDEVLPLADSLGSGEVTDFVQTMFEHKSDYAIKTHKYTHVNSRREPIPMFIEDFAPFKQPGEEFVTTFYRYLYVSNLPPHLANGALCDIENAEHRSRLEKMVAKLCSVDSTQVSATSATSAIVGFKSPRELADALKYGPAQRTLEQVPSVEIYDGKFSDEEGVKAFVEDAPSHDSILFLENLRLDYSKESLAQALTPPRSGLAGEFGSLDPENILILPSGGSALVRVENAEKSKQIKESPLMDVRLAEMGQYTINYLRGRRELIHEGFDDLDDQKELREFGPNIIIDGLHMPWKQFYISHASALQVRNLPPGIEKSELTKIFQEYSKTRRDARGSIQFVECELTGEQIMNMAYIGFDEPGEALACYEASKDGKIKIGDHEVHLYLCEDREIPGIATAPHVRRTRSVAELEDEMKNWQKYVDQSDIDYLDQNGMPYYVLDEILRGFRRRNDYFGALDSPIEDETIEPKMAGQLYKEIVQLTIECIKECVATREDPGEYFYEQIYPGDEPDFSVFDEWEQKIKPAIDAAYAEKARRPKLLD